MKISLLPIDNRPVCYNLVKDIASIDNSIELFLPNRELLGDLTKQANVEALFDWLKSLEDVDCIILSLDTLIYGGLIPSRRSKDTFEIINERLNTLKQILETKMAKVYAFSSIMRISNNNYNEEEKEYWSEYGKKIFEYSFEFHKTGIEPNSDIPKNILEDYVKTRTRNFEVNKRLLQFEKDGLFEFLIFSKDDCAQYGFNVMEANELKNMGANIKTGADEIPLTLLARALKKEIKIFVEYIEPENIDLISNYEDVSIKKSVEGQLELAGFNQVLDSDKADIILIVNNFKIKQGEHVMSWDTEPFNKAFNMPNKSFAIADVRFANGADNNFVEMLLQNIDLKNFYGYAGWNTSANTLGSLLATIKTKFKANQYNDIAFKKLQLIRFLDDWAYQANVRKMINKPQDISTMMKPYENKLFKILDINPIENIKYSYPWNRKFEIEVDL
ncbi:MAG: DUF4127 family protein [bacterium]|nr:DUF4127 family protein [bacterium]